MESVLVLIVLVIILGGACRYIYKAKKRGQTCIGCPHAKECGSKRTCEKND